mmetsp:Transcript_19639/g.41795  ORF Transcript_19639/g.41795 Transcript_19639/m.41795 type:complete len:230 (-) Transcript_19639:24-713(-)
MLPVFRVHVAAGEGVQLAARGVLAGRGGIELHPAHQRAFKHIVRRVEVEPRRHAAQHRVATRRVEQRGELRREIPRRGRSGKPRAQHLVGSEAEALAERHRVAHQVRPVAADRPRTHHQREILCRALDIRPRDHLAPELAELLGDAGRDEGLAHVSERLGVRRSGVGWKPVVRFDAEAAGPAAGRSSLPAQRGRRGLAADPQAPATGALPGVDAEEFAFHLGVAAGGAD